MHTCQKRPRNRPIKEQKSPINIGIPELHVGGERRDEVLEVAPLFALLHLNRAANEGHNIAWKKFRKVSTLVY
jgi:hypothetical protein